MIAAGAGDGTARVWDLPASTMVATLSHSPPVREPVLPVYAVAFSPDGRRLATGTVDGTVRLWALPTPVLAQHGQAALSLAYRPDGRMIIIGGSGGVARLWDLAGRSGPEEVLVLPNAVTGADRPSGKPRTRWFGAIHAVAFNDDGRALVMGGDGSVLLWDLGDPRHPVPREQIGSDSPSVLSVEFEPGGDRIGIGYAPATPGTKKPDPSAEDWDAPISGGAGCDEGGCVSGPLGALELGGNTGAVNAVAFTPDGLLLITGGEDHMVRIWDTTTGTLQAARDGGVGEINTLALSRDGRTLAIAGASHRLTLWKVTEQSTRNSAHIEVEFAATVEAHTGPVQTAAFSPDGKTLATGGSDRIIRLWDVSDPTRPTTIALLTGHASAVLTAAFSPDGRTLATGSDDGDVRLWDVDLADVTRRVCAVSGAPVTPGEWRGYVPGLPYEPPC